MIYDTGTEWNAWSSHCLPASWDREWPGMLSSVIFKGDINFESNQRELLLGKKQSQQFPQEIGRNRR